jgi:hypothetical protein
MPNGVDKGYYKPTYFGNAGYSSSEIYSLVLEPVKPIKFSNVEFGYMLGTSWEKKSSNFLMVIFLQSQEEFSVSK